MSIKTNLVNDFDYIEMPSPEEFYDRYMSTLTPVVIKDLFEGEAIRDIKTLEQALEVFAEMEIDVQDEYITRFSSNINKKAIHTESNLHNKPRMPFRDYFHYINENRHEKKMCMEFPAPEQLASLYSLPEVCKPTDGESDYLMNQCFVGNRGNSARVHFDKGGTHGFLYQVFGKKRFIVFPHKSASKLATFTQFGAWAIDRMDEQERRDFLKFSGGQEVILDAGDCMYVPMLSWHYADYVEDSMSISIRFRRPNFVTQLANQLFPDQYYQGIAQKIQNKESANENYKKLLADIDKAFAQPSANGKEKVKAMRKLSEEVYAGLYDTDVQASRLLFNLEDLLPPLLNSFLDADDPKRPVYK